MLGVGWTIARDKVFGIWDGVTGILNQQYIAQYGLLHLLKLFFPISFVKIFDMKNCAARDHDHAH